ncbi:MAG: 50S ribosomal protein L1 [Verrucomicrobia bacterium]|jgi:large subunit ribosomal protein L1|nr:50S ribosomal protein L1 [Verrucomicrobiota bacterium]NBS84042.1 50S ribosomal protein L1 [Verrucomicrobiota bacterium]
MAKITSRRYREGSKLLEPKKRYSVQEAVSLLKKMPTGKSKGNPSVDLSFNLGVDPKQSDQVVRGTVSLPHGSGKNVRVIVFAQGNAAEAAKNAGAVAVGYADLIKKVSEGWADFDVAVATPDAMIEVRKLGKVLGPRGLMPNPKTGTVTEDTVKAVKECQAGRVEFKIDKGSNLHVSCGKLNFEEKNLGENVQAVIESVSRARPSGAKGKYLKNCVLSATFSPGIPIAVTEAAAGSED